MPRGPYPALLMLAMSLPGGARALGLGDIRVNSALNEPLSAQIDLMGATPEELATLKAQIADEAMFRRYGAERPSYLSTVRFQVATNSQGRPVLEVRSAQPFADPIVNFLVDIRWPKGELVRDFSLLLDPAVYPPGSRPAAATAAMDGLDELKPTALIALPPGASRAPVILTSTPASAASMTPDTAIAVPPADHGSSVYHVMARDTLYDIVRRAGALTQDQALQMMIAVFRANPDAFDRNINVLRRGALLTLPSAREMESVGAADARRSVAQQMRAWRLYSTGAGFRPVGSGVIAVPPSVQAEAASAQVDKLNSRVQSLEEALEAEQRQVASLKASIEESRQPVALPPIKPPAIPVKASPAPATARVGPGFRSVLLSSIALVLGLPLLGLAMLRARRPRSVATPRPVQEPHVASVAEAIAASVPVQGANAAQPDGPGTTVEMPAPEESAVSAQPANNEATTTTEVDTELLEQLEADYAAAEIPTADAAAQGRTANDTVEVDTVILDGEVTEEAVLAAVEEQVAVKRLSTTQLDYNLVDLDSRAPHVHLPSDLNDRQAFKERRTSVVDALRVAIERDPLRRDLSMKLLETYHSTASANRRAFAEFLRMQTKGPNSLSAEDWKTIIRMGRDMALDESLLAHKDDDDLANCA
jgi:pilus assembly protein FimV